MMKPVTAASFGLRGAGLQRGSGAGAIGHQPTLGTVSPTRAARILRGGATSSAALPVVARARPSRTGMGERLNISGLSGLRVFHVDDQAVILRSVATMLAGSGMILDGDTNPVAALERIVTDPPDLLILDFIMPEVDGVTLFNRCLDRGVLVPTLFLSGSQGNRQAAALLNQLDSDLKVRGLPIAYQRKDVEGIDTQLVAKLLRLATAGSFDEEGVRAKLPSLRSIVAEAQRNGNAASLSSAEAIAFREGCELLLDHRFSFLHALIAWKKEVEAWMQRGPKAIEKQKALGQQISYLQENIQEIQVPLHELLSFPYVDWHSYKGKWAVFGMAFMSFKIVLEKSDSRRGRELLQGLEALRLQWRPITELAKNLSSFSLEESVEPIPIREELGKTMDSFDSFHRMKFQREVEVPEVLTLTLPSRLLWNILRQLLLNAGQHTPVGANPPTVVAGLRKREAREWLYLGVRNVAEKAIPPEVQARMFGETYFTTSQFGTGFGLTHVRTLLSLVGGTTEVRSDEGQTEIGVYIPIPQ